MLDGKRRWLERPSTLFDLLLRGRRTRRHGAGEPLLRARHPTRPRRRLRRPRAVTRRDRRHRPVPRLVLLAAFDAAGVARPGRPATAPPRPRRAAPAARRGTDPELPPARPIEELLAELDALVGLRAGQGRRPPPDQPAAHPAAARRARAADAGDQPPRRVHGQPGHRQDDRRPAAQPDPAHARHRLQGPPRRDRPLATSSPATSARPPSAPAPCWSRRSAARCSSTRPTPWPAAASRTSAARPSTRSSSSWRTTATTSPSSPPATRRRWPS